MGKVTGFLEYTREVPAKRPVAERVNDWFHVFTDFPEDKAQVQAGRCMDCGVPFCNSGCPVANLIPDWNDLVFEGRWLDAYRRLEATNNFPEFTGTICPAPCEASCVLGINDSPVAIKQIELSIIEHAFREGYVQPQPPALLTGKRVAVIGSGPAGLAAAQQLCRAGHAVTVYEKSDRLGGLMRYGVPDFKMEKRFIDRRIAQMEAEGVRFLTGVHVGKDVSLRELQSQNHAVLLAGGAEQPRDLQVPGRELKGIHFAMDFLTQQNRRCAGDAVDEAVAVLGKGKHVIIIGDGDTGADCLGTTHRHAARSVRQFATKQMPPKERAPHTPWPLWPVQYRIESSHEEGGEREWGAVTTHFTGDANGNVQQLHGVRVGPPPRYDPVPGGEFALEVDLVLIAIGFHGPHRLGLLEDLRASLDPRGHVVTNEDYMSSVDGIFAAGDMRRGQSLVVWAIAEGRKAAAGIDRYLSRPVA